jgi:peptidoglycan-associated lipoprotein
MKPVSLLFVIGVSAAVLAGACGKKQPQVIAPVANADSAAAAEKTRADSAAAAQAEADRRAREEADRVARQRQADSLAALSRTTDEVKSAVAAMIHFDYDKATVRPDDAGILDQKVAVLQANPALKIRVHGHCDERGSDEYNLALGNRRAQAAKQYLVSHGIDAGRIETQSWGEEKPLVDGHDEAAWSQNRRDEFEIIGGGDALRRP